MTEATIYARPDGSHYHTDRSCPMLAGGDFETLRYKEITKEEAKKRRLKPCACADKKRPAIT